MANYAFQLRPSPCPSLTVVGIAASLGTDDVRFDNLDIPSNSYTKVFVQRLQCVVVRILPSV